MNTLHKYVASMASSLLCILAFSAPHPAVASPGKTENAQALLEEVKTQSLERKIAAKQTELDRLDEDAHKAKLQAEALERSIEKVTAAIAESNGHIEQIDAQKKRLTEMLEIVALRSDAERTKSEGLKLLGKAQKKLLDAIAKNTEEMELKSGIARVEMNQLSPKELPIIGAAGGVEAGNGKHGTATEMRKKLVKVSSTNYTANIAAREAIAAASGKLQQADAAWAKAARRGSELGIEEIQNLPPRNTDDLGLSTTLPRGDTAPAKGSTPEKTRSKR